MYHTNGLPTTKSPKPFWLMLGAVAVGVRPVDEDHAPPPIACLEPG
jgi:hypothetical protein